MGSTKSEQMSKPAATKTEKAFARLGLNSAADFIVHLPIRYEDETRVIRIVDAKPGEFSQFEGTILATEASFKPRRQLKVILVDDSSRITLRWLHVYPGQQARYPEGKQIRAQGEVRVSYTGLEIVHPKISDTSKALPKTLTPIYPTTQGLSQTSIRKAIDKALNIADLSETLPTEIIKKYSLAKFAESIRLLHKPSPDISLDSLLKHEHPAWLRIKFDELLAQQISLTKARLARKNLSAIKLQGTRLAKAIIKSLPFNLTAAQIKASQEISHDLQLSYPMHRLLQGDVGSGKTLVAALAAAKAVESGYQVALMAPTEILAEQLANKFAQWFKPLGINTDLLTGSLKQSDKKIVLENIASGNTQIAIGTQALIQEKVKFFNLALVISDEQHRFGVGQRLLLNQKGDSGAIHPHQLSMSATPIPRTLAMAFFADMEVSVINELPPGRTPVRTRLFDSGRRDEVLSHLGESVRSGKQAYWVCPLVEESEALQLETAVDTYELLKQRLPDLTIGLMHGRLSAQEKAQTMADFAGGQINLLVSTTVIEVGVDVPNASLMIIEHAERFGLSQLHQLRGRVGRGSEISSCILLYQQPLSEIARARLQAMYETTDGFEIAQRDLEQRGPGELLGLRQSGQILMRFANILEDDKLIELARTVAAELMEKYPDYALSHQQRWLGKSEDYLRI